MKKSHLSTLSIILVLGITTLLFKFSINNKITYRELNCYEAKIENRFERLFIVDKPPKSIIKFKDFLIKEIDSGMIDKKTRGKEIIYFVKERDLDLVDRHFRMDNKLYSNCSAEIDSEDFLCKIHYFFTNDNRDTFVVSYYAGEYYFY